jgi:hypothetical protein
MNVFAFQKDARAKRDCLKVSPVSKPIKTPFAGFTGLFSTSSGRRSRAASPTSSGRFSPPRRPLTRLIPPIRHSTFTF